MHLTAVFNIFLELKRDCSDKLTLICRHAAVPNDPNWIHNGTTSLGGELLTFAFPMLTMYSFQNSTEHRVTVTGVDDVTALDGYVFQCVYSIGGTPIKSNAVKYSFVPISQSQYISTINYALHCCQQFIYCVTVCLIIINMCDTTSITCPIV